MIQGLLYIYSYRFYTSSMLQFGLRAHDFGKDSVEILAARIGQYGVSSIQLALTKALTSPPYTLGMLSPGYGRNIAQTFSEHKIAIAVLGCYINLVHPDAAARHMALSRFEEHLRFCRDFGCSVVGTETGSCNPDCSYHPDTAQEKTFETLLRSIERLVKTAERYGVIVGLEAVAGQHTIDSAEKMARLLSIIDSPNLQVIYDPVNLLPVDVPPEVDIKTLENSSGEHQKQLFEHDLEILGDKIVTVHLKDFRYENKKKIGNLPALSGWLDTRTLLGMIMKRKPCIDVLLENSDPSITKATLTSLHQLIDDSGR